MLSKDDFEVALSIDKASASDQKIKKTIDCLSKTLQFGAKLRNDRLRSEEKKRRAVFELKSRMKETVAKHQKLNEEIAQLNSELRDSKLRIQKQQYAFEVSLTTLGNLIKSRNRSNASAQRVKLVEELQTFYLKHFARILLALRDYAVRPCRDSGLQAGLNESEFEQVLVEAEKVIRALHQDIEASINRMDGRKKEVKFKIFQNDPIEEDVKGRFLTAMEASAFDYNHFDL